MRRRTYAPVEDHRWLTLTELAAEIGRSPGRTRKLLAKAGLLVGMLTKKKGNVTLYDASTVEVLKAVIGVPHRPVVPPGDDWLTQWIGEHDA